MTKATLAQDASACITRPGCGFSQDGTAAACRIGTFSSGNHQQPCTPCPSSLTTKSTSAESISACMAPPGFFFQVCAPAAAAACMDLNHKGNPPCMHAHAVLDVRSKQTRSDPHMLNCGMHAPAFSPAHADQHDWLCCACRRCKPFRAPRVLSSRTSAERLFAICAPLDSPLTAHLHSPRLRATWRSLASGLCSSTALQSLPRPAPREHLVLTACYVKTVRMV